MPGMYKKVEIVGTSPISYEEAIRAAVAEASNTIRHMSWFEVTEMRGMLKDGKVAEFQVVLKIGFRMER